MNQSPDRKDATVLRQIAGLKRMPMPQLQEMWRTLNGTEPPTCRADMMVRRLAYRIQELAYGGLSDTAKARMRDVLTEQGLNELGCEKSGKARRKPNMPVLGTRLIREWQGQRYEVVVVRDGLEWQGRKYRSLTAVAKAITGTHWNGHAFFGLRAKKGDNV